jgi:RNA polymerase sigma-70 factor (subfamily 1)
MKHDIEQREEELALLRRFRDGDEAALELLFERHSSALTQRILRSLPAPMRRRMAVSDVIQETHLAAFQSRAAFEDRGAQSFRCWLLGIVDNKVRQAIRHHVGTAQRSMKRELTRSKRPDTAALGPSDPSPSQAAVASETTLQVRDAIAALPEDYGRILRLTRYDGLNLREAAEEMGRSHAAARQLYGRALRRLSEALAASKEG